MRFSPEITVAYFILQALLTSYIKDVSAKNVPEVKAEKDDLDGMDFLSEWSEWSRCSRTCGTGIQFRGRRCNRDRSPCLRYPRQHRTCNNQLCPLNSPKFRDVQCAKENDREVMLKGKKAKWKSIERGTTKCMLFCYPIGHRIAFYLGRAQDGTKCIDEPYSVCVAGKCTSVGCDRVLGSQKIFDRCKVCGGNGSTCKAYSGMIDREPTAEEKKEGYMKLFVIPEGATTILISEVSQNYLAIKGSSGVFVFGGDKKMSDPGTYRINATDFQYSKLPSEKSEAVMIMGPTKEDFYVMAILTDKDNPKADYEYWLPKNRPTTPPKPVFKVHTLSSSAKRRVTSKTTPRKIIFDESDFLKDRKTELYFSSSERPPRTQPMTTAGDLGESSTSTPEQHISTEYPTTSTFSSPHTQPMTTAGDLGESSPSTPEQHISTEYPTTSTFSSPHTQPMTTAGDLGESSPSTPEQHISTEYPTTTASLLSSHHTQPMITAGDLGESSPSTPEQHISTEYPTTTTSLLSSPRTQPMTTAGDLGESSPSTEILEHSTTPQNESTVTDPSTSASPQSTDTKPVTTKPYSSATSFQTSPGTSTFEHPIATHVPATNTRPLIQRITETVSSEYSDKTGNFTPGTSANSSTNGGEAEGQINKVENRTLDNRTEYLPTQPTVTEDQNATVQPTATEDENATVQPTATEDENATVQPTATEDQDATVQPTATENQNATAQPTATEDQNATVQPTATENKNATVQPTATENKNATVQPTATENKNATAQPTATEDQNATVQPTATENKNATVQPTATEDQNATVQPTATENKNATVQPTATENKNATVQPTATENKNATVQPTATEDQNATVQPTAIEDQNATAQPTATEDQNATVQPTATENKNATVQPTATEDQNAAAQPTATENQNATVQPTATEEQNATVQPTATENQNATAQPTATEDQNATVQPTATENKNATVQPTATKDQNATANQNATVQPTATEDQNATAQPTATEDQNATVQPTATEDQNAIVQPTATEDQNATVQPTATEDQNATVQPTATENQNATVQPTATEDQNPTVQPTATENQNATVQPTATENQNATVQPTATEDQNATVQPTATEDQNATAQPTATEDQNATVQPTATEDQNATVQPTATEDQNATVLPTATEDQNATVQPTATEDQNATAQPTVAEDENATAQPTATEDQNATAQPTATEDQNITVQPTATEDQNATAQPTATEDQNITVQPTATEDQNATVQPTATEDQNITVQPTATEDQNATAQPTATEDQNITVQPTAIEVQNTTSLYIMTAHINTTSSTTTRRVNIAFEKVAHLNFTEQSNRTIELNNATQKATTTAAMEITVADITTTEQPTTIIEQTAADKQFIDSGNYSSKEQPTTEESLTTKQEINYNGTVLPTNPRVTNSTVSPTLEGTDKLGNRTSEYMTWSHWTPCSRTCGLGFKVRARLCKHSNESVCSRNETQVALCTIRQCEKIVPSWSPWRPWTECSSQCGIGLRIRVRSCRNSKVMTLIRTSCPGRRYDIEICRSFANCSSRVNMVKQSNAFITVAKSTMKTPSTSSCQEKPCQTPSLISSATPKASLSYTRATASRAVSQSAMSNHLVVDDINTKTISKMVLPVTAKMSSPTSSLTTGGIFSERGENDVLVTRGMGFSTPVETFIRMTPSTTLTASTAVPSITQSPFTSLSSTAFSLSLSTSSSSTGFLASSSSSSSSSSLSPSTLPSSTAFSSSSSSQSFLSSSSPLASASSSTSKPSPSTSLPSIPTSASASTFSSLSPSPSSPSSSSSSSLPTSSSIMSQPVSCVSCVYAATKSSTHSKASSDHPLPTRSYQMTSLEPSLSTTVIQTPKLSTSSPSMQDTIKTPSVQKPRTSSSFGGRFEAVTMSKVYTSEVTSIEPSRTSVVTTQESSTRIVQGHSNSCSRCRTSEKKQKLFCKGDYAIHVQVRNGSTTSNNKTVYHLLVQNIYKSNLPLSRDLFIRVTGIQCPCPWLQTGKEYLVIGRARRTQKGYSKIIINRRSFVEEWSGSVNSEVEVLRNRCVALGFNVSSSYLKTVDLKRTNNGENNPSVAEGPSVIPTTGAPGTSMSTLPATIINKYSDCPPCILSVNSSIGALYCTSEYAIRARITKYRKATNRTMFYAHLVTTYKTTSKLPVEVLIRVPGEKCPCPRLVPGVEYLMIGKTKLTLNGKRRLTLSVESFYTKWRDEFEKEIDTTKTRCGLPLVTSQPDDNSTVASHQSTTTTAPTVNPTIMPTTAQSNSSCPSCDQSTVVQNQQKRFCKNENVFRGRVTKSIPTATNRTLYYITMVASFKTNFEMPDKIVARLSDNSCQCSHLTVGKDYLIMGQVKLNKKGKGRVVLTKKSFVQDWNPDFIQKIDQLKAKCGFHLVNNKSGPSTEPSGTPLGKTPTPSKAVKPTTVAKVTRNEACPPCRVSANIHDFCSNDYVFRGRVLKGYRTSANRTVYHVSLTTSYKSLANLTSVILVRIPGVSCPCPQLQVGVQYVFMGWVRVKRKSVSTIALNPKNFAQKWDEGFEEELSSIRSSCKKSLVVDGPLVQSVSAKKDKTSPTTGVTPQPSTASVTTSTIETTTQAPPPTASLNLTGTIEKRCAPCQTSRKRNRLYCASDYVVTVEIEKKEHNPVTQNTKYFAAVKYTFKQKDPLELMVILWVLNNECNCPNLQLNHSYVVMVNSDFGENGIERLVMSERSFIKKWTKGLQRRISKLRNNCNTDHKGRY